MAASRGPHGPKCKEFFEIMENRPDRFLRFLDEKLGVKTRLEEPWGTWDIEEQIILSTFETPRIREVYVRAANSTSKTHGAGIIGNAWLICHPGSKIIYLSTKREQAKTQAWAEFRGLYNKIHRWGKRNGVFFPDPMMERVDMTDDWWARVYAGQVRGEKSKSTGWSGFHAKYLLFIIDEALGIPDMVREMVSGCATSKHNVILAQGNPISRGTDEYSWWYEGQIKPAPHRKIFAVAARTSPNYQFEAWARAHFEKHGEWPEHPKITIDEDGDVDIEELIPGLAGWEWIAAAEADPRTCPGTAYHFGHILGEFPIGSEWGLIRWDDIQVAAEKSQGWQRCIEALGFEDWRSLMEGVGTSRAIAEIEKKAAALEEDVLLPDFGRLAIGVDVADSGGNLNVITVLAGDKVLEQRAFDGKASLVVPPEVEKVMKAYDHWAVGIDKPGVGAGPAAILQEKGLDVMEFKGGIPAEGKDERQEYANLNAEMAWIVRDRFSKGEIEIPDDEDLKNQCGMIQWQYTDGNRVKVPKPKHSPDKFDSLRIAVWVQTFADYSPEVVGAQLGQQRGQFGDLEGW